MKPPCVLGYCCWRQKKILPPVFPTKETVFTRFDIQPVFKDKNVMTLDFFENKNLYFIRVNGAAKRMM
jgi:hypothetical protein